SHTLFALKKLEVAAQKTAGSDTASPNLKASEIAQQLADEMAKSDELVKHYTDNGMQPAPGTTATPEEIQAGAELAMERHTAATNLANGPRTGGLKQVGLDADTLVKKLTAEGLTPDEATGM